MPPRRLLAFLFAFLHLAVAIPANATIHAGRAVTILSASLPLPLANSSLIHIHPESNARYLLETDPRFTNYRTWLGSDYMLAALAFDPALTQKRLGDGFYEQRLITEQIAQLTGRRFLAGYSDDETQYLALMNAGLTVAREWQLIPGVALSAAQMAALTSDIIWLVEQTVTLSDGSTQRVLVPQVYVRVQDGDLKPSGALIAADKLQLQTTGDLVTSGAIAGRQIVSLTAANLTNLRGSITGADVQALANNNLSVLGGAIEAKNSLFLSAKNDLTLASTTADHAYQLGDPNFTGTVNKTAIDRVAGLYVQGGTLIAVAGNDLNVLGAAIINKGTDGAPGSTALIADNNLNLGTVTESHDAGTQFQVSSDRGYSGYWKENASSEIGSVIETQGDLILSAGNDLTAKAAQASSEQGALVALAGGNITLTAGADTLQSDLYKKTKNSNGLSSSKIETRDQIDATTHTGSTFSGDTVLLQAGLNPERSGNIAIAGSNVVATKDAALIASGDITITSLGDTRAEAHEYKKKTSGLSASGASISVGNSSLKVDQEGQVVSQQKSTVGSTDGNVTIQAGKTYTQIGSDVIALKGDVDISAQKVNIQESRETAEAKTETQYKQSGITLALSSPVISAVQTAEQMAKASKDTGDDRMKVLAAGAATLSGVNAYDAVSKGQGGTINGKDNQIVKTDAKGQPIWQKDAAGNNLLDAAGQPIPETRDATAADKVGGINISISVGSSKSQSSSEQKSDNALGSNVKAGGNIRITATGAGENSNILIQGSDVIAKDITLTADNRIDLLAAQNTAEQHSNNKSSSASIGISFGSDGLMLNLSASGARGNADGNDVIHSNSHVIASNTLTLNSGGDTNIKGAVAKGEQVVTHIGGNLAIESLQDTSHFDSKQTSVGGSLSIGYGRMSGSFSASQSKIDSDYASVNEQSGIQAGDGGFQVNVHGNTDLKGGVITSTQKAIDDGKNSFSTGGELTLSDIENYAHYQASSVGVNVGAAPNLSGQFTPQGSGVGVGSDSGRASSTTLAAISDIAGNKEARTGDKETGIQKIFDAEKVQKEINAQVKITQTFGQQAPEAWGKYANDKFVDAVKNGDEEAAACWAPNGACRAGGHALIGGLTGGVAGAVGAGVSSMLAPELLAFLKQNDVPDELANALVVAATTGTGAALGGTSGAAGAFNESANNALWAAPWVVEGIIAAGATAIRACLTSLACQKVIMLAGVAVLDKMVSMLPEEERALVPGYGAGKQPPQAGPLVNVPVERDPKDGVLVNTPPDVDMTLPGYTPEKPKYADGPLITPNDGPAGPTLTLSDRNRLPIPETVTAGNGLQVESNPKHTLGMPGNNWNAGTEPANSLELFNSSIEGGPKAIALYTIISILDGP